MVHLKIQPNPPRYRARRFLGRRVRALRRQWGWSQERLGEAAGLSGKFIGEVERGRASISVDNLCRVSRALRVPMRILADVPPQEWPLPSRESERLFALLVQHRRPEELRKAYRVLRSLFGES